MTRSPLHPPENRPAVEAFPGDPMSASRDATSDAQSHGNPQSQLLQIVDADARRLARDLLRSAREAVLAVLRPDDGYPAASRVLVATDFEGRPVLLLSGLSLHATALAADRRCSLLVGRPGKGDPLAHPRMTIFADAQRIGLDDAERAALRERTLARHPKAALYVDFPDFFFVRLEPTTASLNGGFAKAFELQPEDLIDAATPELQATAIRARDHMNADHAGSIDEIAASKGCDGTGWRIATMDSRGFEIVRGDMIRRIEFPQSVEPEAGGYRIAFVDLVKNGAGR